MVDNRRLPSGAKIEVYQPTADQLRGELRAAHLQLSDCLDRAEHIRTKILLLTRELEELNLRGSA